MTNTQGLTTATEEQAAPTYPCTCGCGWTTKRVYAPGHDARHAGRVAKAQAEGRPNQADRDLLSAALKIKADDLTARWIAKAEAKAARKAARQAAAATRASKPPKGAKAPVEVTAKVGRWIYTGMVRDGAFHYHTKTGTAMVAKDYTLI